MSKFEVQLRWDFNPGDIKGGTEMPPAYLLDEKGHMMVLARWPREPLTVEAVNAQRAVESAQATRGSDRTIFVNDRIGRARVEELTKRRRPGSEDRYTSVIAIWVARPEGDDSWRMVSSANNPEFGA